jgi:heptosyltransferase-2
VIPEPQTIAVRGVNWLGDAVMSTPALVRLREHFRSARIILVTPAKIAQLWTGHRAIDEIISFGPEDSFTSISARLRIEQVDLGVILPNSFRSAAEMFWARIPRRIGYAGQLRSLLLSQAVHPRSHAVPMQKRTGSEIQRLIAKTSPHSKREPSEEAHHIYQYLHLIAATGAAATPVAPTIEVDAMEVEQARQKFGIQPGGVPLIGINPGAEYGPAKRWPFEYFVETVTTLAQSIRCQFILFGGNNDIETAARLSREISRLQPSVSNLITNLAGRTSLRELCALAKACRIFISNDTGPMHIAAAVGTTVVSPFGSTSSALTGPWPTNQHHLLEADVPCAPCFLRECPIDFRCMHQIAPARLITAALKELKLGISD